MDIDQNTVRSAVNVCKRIIAVEEMEIEFTMPKGTEMMDIVSETTRYFNKQKAELTNKLTKELFDVLSGRTQELPF